MAIDVSGYVTDETTSGNGTLLDDLVALAAASTPVTVPPTPSATPAQLLPFATLLADAIGRALQHIKDDADVLGVGPGDVD